MAYLAATGEVASSEMQAYLLRLIGEIRADPTVSASRKLRARKGITALLERGKPEAPHGAMSRPDSSVPFRVLRHREEITESADFPSSRRSLRLGPLDGAVDPLRCLSFLPTILAVALAAHSVKTFSSVGVSYATPFAAATSAILMRRGL
jgi:hypothetical protein